MKLFDLHCDTIYECCETGKHLRENDLHINYAAAHRYQPYVQFFALFCGARQPYSPETRDCLLDTPADERFDRMLTTARREFAANADWLTFCRSAADIRAAVEAGKGGGAALYRGRGAAARPAGRARLCLRRRCASYHADVELPQPLRLLIRRGSERGSDRAGQAAGL